MKKLMDDASYGKGLTHAAYVVALGLFVAGAADKAHRSTFFLFLSVVGFFGLIIWWGVKD